MTAGARREQEPRLRKVVTDFWFAVQRMGLRREGPPPGFPKPPPDGRPSDDGLSGSGVPRRPAPSSGSASAAETEPSEDRSE